MPAADGGQPGAVSARKSLESIRVVKEGAAPPAAPKVSGPKHREPKADTAAGIDHYRTYKPRPFTREERDDTTILFGGLHWRAERVIQGSMEGLGYRAQVLPTATREDLLLGRELADIGQCCPTSFVTGNLAGYLRDK